MKDTIIEVIDACWVPLLRRCGPRAAARRRGGAGAELDLRLDRAFTGGGPPLRRGRKRSSDAEHAEIMRAALASDTGTAIVLLREHYERSLQIILDSGPDLGATPGQGDSASAQVSATDRPALR